MLSNDPMFGGRFLITSVIGAGYQPAWLLVVTKPGVHSLHLFMCTRNANFKGTLRTTHVLAGQSDSEGSMPNACAPLWLV